MEPRFNVFDNAIGVKFDKRFSGLGLGGSYEPGMFARMTS